MKIRSYLTWRFLPLITIVFSATGLLSADPKPAGIIKISAWEFDRGNAIVSENPGMYGDYRDKHPELMLTCDGRESWFVEYDVDFPGAAEYTLKGV